MISKSLLAVGGVAIIVSVNAFPSFQNTGLENLVSWSLESETAIRSKRDSDDPDCDARCQKIKRKEEARAAKVAAKAEARRQKEEAKAAKVQAKQEAKDAKVQAKQEAREAKVQAKQEAREAKVAAKEAAREKKIADKREAFINKVSGKLGANKLDANDKCVPSTVAYTEASGSDGFSSGSFTVTKPADAPNNAGWYVMVDPPKKHSASDASTDNDKSVSFDDAIHVTGFSSWCDVEGGSTPESGPKTIVASFEVTYSGTTSAANWPMYYCYSPVGEGDDEELQC